MELNEFDQVTVDDELALEQAQNALVEQVWEVLGVKEEEIEAGTKINPTPLESEGETPEESPPLTEREKRVEMIFDVIESFEVAKAFSQKIEEHTKGEYNRLYELSQLIVSEVEEPQAQLKEFDSLSHEAENKWMVKHHSGTKGAKKRNGQWKTRTYMSTAYASAKSTVRKGIEAGVIDAGNLLGKTALAKEAKKATGIAAPAMSATLSDEDRLFQDWEIAASAFYGATHKMLMLTDAQLGALIRDRNVRNTLLNFVDKPATKLRDTLSRLSP